MSCLAPDSLYTLIPSRVPDLAQIPPTGLLIGSITIIPLIRTFGGCTAVAICPLVDLLLRVALAVLGVGVQARRLLSIASCLTPFWNRI